MRFLRFVGAFTVLAFICLMAVPARAQVGTVGATPGDFAPPIDKSRVHLDQHLGTEIPMDAQFRDRKGHSVKFGELLEGKPAVILPIFYRCTGVCNLELKGTLATLAEMKTKTLAKDFNIIVVGIHPKETPDLAEGKYQSSVKELNQKGTENGWKFLTGDYENIHRVTNAIGFYYTYDEALNAIDHPSGIVFVSPKGKVSSYIYGALYSPAAFDKNLNLAAREKVGDKAEELFFGCIHVDPLTGKRSLVIINLLKVLATLTLAIMVVSFMVLTGRSKLGRGKEVDATEEA